jgi:5-methylcytosine-specific restriction endonuclease McrA
MESNKKKKRVRDYKKEYARDHGSPAKIRQRSLRNQARRAMGLRTGDPREVDHIKPLSKGGGNGLKNIRAVSFATNRSKGNRAK